MERLTSSVTCKQVTDKYLRYFTFDAEKWFSDENNFAVIEDDNIAFAEYKSEGIYWVHFCFNSARGRKAINLVNDIFEYFCKERLVKTVVGLIEIDNKKALWLIRQCHFESLGITETPIGICEMFYRNNDGIF